MVKVYLYYDKDSIRHAEKKPPEISDGWCPWLISQSGYMLFLAAYQNFVYPPILAV